MLVRFNITTISSFQRTISEKSYDLSKPSKTYFE